MQLQSADWVPHCALRHLQRAPKYTVCKISAFLCISSVPSPRNKSHACCGRGRKKKKKKPRASYTVRLPCADLQSSFKQPSSLGPPCLYLSLLGDTTAIKIHQSDAVATLPLRQNHAPSTLIGRKWNLIIISACNEEPRVWPHSRIQQETSIFF